MSSKILLFAALFIPLALCAQQPANPMQGGVPVAQPAANIVVPGTNIYVVGGGLYGTGVYVVPNAGGTAPAGATTLPGNIGISLAGSAGISLNTPVYLGVESTLIPQNPVVLNANGYFTPGGAGGTAASTGGTAESGRLINDVLPSYPESAVASAAPVPSLGDVATQYKSAPPHSVRMYTNEDAHRISSTVVIGSAVAANAGQPAPPNADVPPQQQEQAPPQNQEMTANQPPPPVVTEPQSPESKESQEPLTRLPATSSPLPLLGLIGLAGAGVGVWLHSRR